MLYVVIRDQLNSEIVTNSVSRYNRIEYDITVPIPSDLNTGLKFSNLCDFSKS